MSILVLIMVILITVGVLPAWPYSFDWGYGPSGAMSLVLLGLVILLRLDDHYSWIPETDDAIEPVLPVDTPVLGADRGQDWLTLTILPGPERSRPVGDSVDTGNEGSAGVGELFRN